MRKTLISLILLSQVAVGCTQYRYDYIPPTSEDGQACVRECMNKKWDCSNNCETNYSNCISSAKNNIVVNVNSNGTPQQTQNNNNSECYWSKSSCTTNCDNFYNDCYKSCGGQINVYEVK